MSQTIELPDKVYEALASAAREDGLTPAEWLAIHLQVADDSTQERALQELLTSLTGAIDSSENCQGIQHTAFSTALAEKFQKQGLRIP
jgi:hypothetical protein